MKNPFIKINHKFFVNANHIKCFGYSFVHEEHPLYNHYWLIIHGDDEEGKFYFSPHNENISFEEFKQKLFEYFEEEVK